MEQLNTLLCYDGAARLRCGCGKAFLLAYCSHDGSYAKGDAESGFYARSGGLSDSDLAAIGSYGDVYAYLLEDAEPISPLPIAKLYADEACEKPLAEAPKSLCAAYVKTIVPDEKVFYDVVKNAASVRIDGAKRVCRIDGNGDWYCSEKTLILSVSPDRARKYANGDAVFDVRTQRALDFGIDYE